MAYNLEYHSALDRSHILPNILNGALQGIIGQFVADIIVTVLDKNSCLIKDDIQISQIPAYYASVASEITYGFLRIYLDPFALTAFTVVTYVYVFELIDEMVNDDPIQIKTDSLVIDILAITIIIFILDPTARNQYLRYQEKRHFQEPLHKRQERPKSTAIIINILINIFILVRTEYDENIIIQ